MYKIFIILFLALGIMGCENKSPVEPAPLPTATPVPTVTPTPVPNVTFIFYVVKKSDSTVLIPNSPVHMVSDRDGRAWDFPNPTGEFTFTVPAGHYHVTITSSGYKTFNGNYKFTTQNGWPWVWALMEAL